MMCVGLYVPALLHARCDVGRVICGSCAYVAGRANDVWVVHYVQANVFHARDCCVGFCYTQEMHQLWLVANASHARV